MNPTFHIQKQYKSVAGSLFTVAFSSGRRCHRQVTDEVSAVPTAQLDVCDIKFQASYPDGIICHLGSNVPHASLSREGDRGSGGRSPLEKVELMQSKIF